MVDFFGGKNYWLKLNCFLDKGFNYKKLVLKGKVYMISIQYLDGRFLALLNIYYV